MRLSKLSLWLFTWPYRVTMAGVMSRMHFTRPPFNHHSRRFFFFRVRTRPQHLAECYEFSRIAIKIRNQVRATFLTFVARIRREFLIMKSSSTILDKIGNYTPTRIDGDWRERWEWTEKRWRDKTAPPLFFSCLTYVNLIIHSHICYSIVWWWTAVWS